MRKCTLLVGGSPGSEKRKGGLSLFSLFIFRFSFRFITEFLQARSLPRSRKLFDATLMSFLLSALMFNLSANGSPFIAFVYISASLSIKSK